MGGTEELSMQEDLENIRRVVAARKEKFNFFEGLYEWVDLLAIIVLLMVFVLFVFKTSKVDGDSMLPTLENGQRLIIAVNNGFFNNNIKRGNIVVVNQPNVHELSIIKRVIATEGQEVDINFVSGEVFVDGVLQKEDYIKELTHSPGGVQFPIVVPPGHVFVMGDNRNHSGDSREPGIGMIDTRYISGKVIFRYWSLKAMGVPK